jgi:predicted ribosomally synthesized peptide with nif11-like leader
MSTDVIDQFMDKVEGDAAFATSLEQALEGRNDKEQALIEFASAAGFELPRDGAAMSDDDLEQVAGGFNPQPEPPALFGSSRLRSYFSSKGIIING